MLTRWLGLLAFVCWTATNTMAMELQLVDDLGEPLAGTVSICRTVGLSQTCDDIELDGDPVPLEPFDSLRVEGPRHGPVQISSRHDGSSLSIPRKTSIVVEGLRDGHTVVLSLYPQDDPLFRRPAHRFELPTKEPLRIPAGSWLASFAESGWAPDLQPLVATPGASQSVQFHHRQGWSAVLRIVDATQEEPVADATLLLRPTPGYGDGPSLRGRSNASGLATFSGIGFELAEAVVQHDVLLPAQAPAVSATAGSFAFRRIELEAGGELSAVVRIDGEPVAGVRCALRSPSPIERELWSEVVSGETDDEGRFGAAPLASGSYSLWIEPPGEEGDPSTGTFTAVSIETGSTTSVDVDLERLEITGRVRVQGEPASGHGMRISQMTTGSETRLENIGSTTTDEDGRYELSVWRTGEYFLWVEDPEQRFLETDRIWVGDHGATRDFDITKQHLQGRVVDAEGRSARGARVVVFFNRSKMWTTGTDDEGRFEFAFNGGGTAELDAFLAGHAKSEQVIVEVPEKGSVPPVVLRLGGRQGLRGTVTLRGVPAAGVRVAAFRPSAAEVPDGVGTAVTGADGGFVLPTANAAGQPLRFFLSGPGCPLTIREAVPDGEAAIDLACAENAGHLLLHLRDDEGLPRAGVELTLARSRVAVPHTVLAAHLAALGLPTVTTGAGALIAAAVEPGSWEVFLAQGANQATIARGEAFGFLTGAAVSAGSTVELELTVE